MSLLVVLEEHSKCPENERKVDVKTTHQTFISKHRYWYVQGGCSGTICLFGHASQKNSTIQQSIYTELKLSKWGVWLHPPAAKRKVVPAVFSSLPWILPLRHLGRDKSGCSSWREEQSLTLTKTPPHGRSDFTPPNEKLRLVRRGRALQHGALPRSFSEKDAVLHLGWSSEISNKLKVLPHLLKGKETFVFSV